MSICNQLDDIVNSFPLSSGTPSLDTLNSAIEDINYTLQRKGGKMSIILSSEYNNFCKNIQLNEKFKKEYFSSDQRFNNLAQEMRKTMMGVDIYIFGNSFSNLASFAELTKLCGGSLSHFKRMDIQNSYFTSE